MAEKKTTKEVIAELQKAIHTTKRLSVLSRRIDNLVNRDQKQYDAFLLNHKADDFNLLENAAANLQSQIVTLENAIKKAEGRELKLLKIELQRCDSMKNLHQVFSAKHNRATQELFRWTQKHTGIVDLPELIDAPIKDAK
jgi:hypothetical protein